MASPSSPNDTQHTDVFGRPPVAMVLTRRSAKISKECVCCNESKTVDEFPSTPPTKACEHEVATCSDCLQLWWTACLQNKYWPVVVCPDCPELLLGSKAFKVNNMLDKDIQRCTYLHERIRNGFNPDFRFCMQPGCLSGQISRDPNTFSCQKCHGSDCVRCDAPFHYHCASHEDYQQTIRHHDAENALSRAHIDGMRAEGKVKGCPNCECLIESFGHATSATCTRCMYSFLWKGGVGAEGGEKMGGEGGGGEEGGAEKGRKVTFTQDEAHFRLINQSSTELGPETVGKGPLA